MAHPKLATVVGRSLLTATAAALMVGPLAAAGAAQTLDGVTDTLDLTCNEAFETGKDALIDEFCTQAELDALTSPLDKSVDEVTETVDKTVTEVAPTTAPEEEAPAEQPDPGTVLPEDDGSSAPAPTDGGGTDVGSTGGSEPRPVDEGGTTTSGTQTNNTRTRTQVRAASSGTPESHGYGYNADGPFRPGMQSHSSLTLQPFAAPLVSVPPVYELPQIAQQLFGSDSAAGAEDPMVASSATQASPYSPAGYSATSADPTGWLAATATGLIMLVGAGHAINGGRTPKQHRA